MPTAMCSNYILPPLPGRPHPPPPRSGADLRACHAQRVQLEVAGMHCSACSNAVEAELRALPGVQSASVSLVMRQATVQVDPALVTPVSVPAPFIARGPLLARCSKLLCVHMSALCRVLERVTACSPGEPVLNAGKPA